MSKPDELNELSNREFRQKRIIAALMLGASAAILAIFALIYLAMSDNNPDSAEYVLIMGGVIMVVAQLIGFRYLSVMTNDIHQKRMALMGQSTDKPKSDKHKT